MELSMFLRLLRRMSPKAKIDVIEKLTAMNVVELEVVAKNIYVPKDEEEE